MGTWGAGIIQDDTVADIVGFVKDRLKEGDALEVASAQAQRKFASTQSDVDEAPLLWLALAEVQWKYGTVDPAVLGRVRKDIQSDSGLERWNDDAKALAARRVALAKFLAKVESPNPKPSAPPKLVVRKPPFMEGDCLSVLLPDGRYTAALVLRADNSNIEYGMNLIASLDYCEREPPGLAVFEKRDWLVLDHGQWNGAKEVRWYIAVRFQRERKRISVVGNVKPRRGDPKDSPSYAGWVNLGVQVLLCRAHRDRQSS
jgi:hypothetical protein